MNKNAYRSSHGFTLIETLMSIGLIVVMISFLVSVFPTARKGLQLSENHMNAAFLGRSVIDGVRAAGFDSAASSTGSVAFTGTDNGAPFSQTINYAVTVTSVDTDQKQVVITLSWHEAMGDKQIVVETLMVKPQGG